MSYDICGFYKIQSISKFVQCYMYLLSSVPREIIVLKMLCLMIRLGFAFLVLNAVLTSVEARDHYNTRERNDGASDTGYQNPIDPKYLPKFKFIFLDDNANNKGLGISAWGIVILVVALILAGMGLYYCSICFSICQTSCQSNICQTSSQSNICQTKSKYDKMGMPTLA